MNIIDFFKNYWILFSFFLFLASYILFNFLKFKSKDILNILIDIIFYLVFFSLIFIFERLFILNLLVYFIVILILILLRILINMFLKKLYKYDLVYFLSPLFIYILIKSNIDWVLLLTSIY